MLPTQPWSDPLRIILVSGSFLLLLFPSSAKKLFNPSNVATSQIPVGIAVARQRLHPDPGLSSAGAGPNSATMKDMHNSRHIGSTFVEMIQGQQLGNNILFSTPSSAPAMIGSWQYPSKYSVALLSQ